MLFGDKEVAIRVRKTDETGQNDKFTAVEHKDRFEQVLMELPKIIVTIGAMVYGYVAVDTMRQTKVEKVKKRGW